jgi:integrative and conjugative element protein (TIGR02256 family)
MAKPRTGASLGLPEPPVTAWMAASALALMAREAAQYPGSETGGMLLGYWQDNDVVLAYASGPGPAAQRGRTWFHPDQEWQTEYLARIYAASGRTITYLGDWHTHPGGSTKPSRTDRKTMRAVRRAPAARQSRPVMAIVAPDPDSSPVLWCLLGWRRPTTTPYRVFDA